MNSEERKIYNKKYYNENKEATLIKMAVKICCPKCNKSVSLGRLQGHQKTLLCSKNIIEKISNDSQIDYEKFNMIFKELEEIKKQLNNNIV